MEQQKDPQQGVKKEKEQFSEEYLRINSRMYENVYPKKDDLVMVRYYYLLTICFYNSVIYLKYKKTEQMFNY